MIILFAVGVCSASSLIGYNALGQEAMPQNSTLIRNGISPQNPALNAFENKTKFGTSIYFEYAIPTNPLNSNYSLSLNSFNVPSISMLVPLGDFGALGVSLDQKFFANNRIELKDSILNADISLNSRIGLYELNPTYSLRLPLALNNFAIGVSYRVFFGNSEQTTTLGADTTWAGNKRDAWMSRGVSVIQKETGDFESAGDWWRPFGASLHFHTKSVDYFFSYFPSVPMKREIATRTQFSNTDTLSEKNGTENFILPKRFATGVHLKFAQNQNISFGYELQDWNGSIGSAKIETQTEKTYFAEYKITGTGLYYSPFLQRNNFGISGWIAQKYIKGSEEYGASIFTDLSLGRRGTLVSLALLGGFRDGGKQYWEEPFVGFKLNLTGVGNWGQSARRR